MDSGVRRNDAKLHFATIPMSSPVRQAIKRIQLAGLRSDEVWGHLIFLLTGKMNWRNEFCMQNTKYKN
jgi:hypothetical protein